MLKNIIYLMPSIFDVIIIIVIKIIHINKNNGTITWICCVFIVLKLLFFSNIYTQNQKWKRRSQSFSIVQRVQKHDNEPIMMTYGNSCMNSFSNVGNNFKIQNGQWMIEKQWMYVYIMKEWLDYCLYDNMHRIEYEKNRMDTSSL